MRTFLCIVIIYSLGEIQNLYGWEKITGFELLGMILWFAAAMYQDIKELYRNGLG